MNSQGENRPEQIVEAIAKRKYAPSTGPTVRESLRESISRHAVAAIRDPIRLARAKLAIAMAPDDNAASEKLRAEEEYDHNTAAMDANRAKRAALISESDHLDRVERAVNDLIAWSALPYRLQSVDESVLHKVLDKPVIPCATDLHYRPPEIELIREHGCEVFLVQHDWAAVMSSAQVDDGVIRLPFDRCCFEFGISGKRVCVLVMSEGAEPHTLLPIVQTSAAWVAQAKYVFSNGQLEIATGNKKEPTVWPIVEKLYAQVRAIAITLDAEVVTTETVRAPHRLNAARLKNGHPPIYDHHVLSLARKSRAAPLDRQAEPSGFHKRLHFRRGHWRHYASHKTWIRWMLVGDPALGFADKDYRL